MKQTIYVVPERNKKMTNKVIEALREQHFTPTFEVLDQRHTVTSDACTVELVVRIQDDTFIITGSSRRAKGDRSDYEVGYYVALARAQTKLARKLTRRAQGLVKHHDDVQDRERLVKEERRREAAARAAVPVRKTTAKKATAAAKKVAHGKGKAAKKTKK